MPFKNPKNNELFTKYTPPIGETWRDAGDIESGDLRLHVHYKAVNPVEMTTDLQSKLFAAFWFKTGATSGYFNVRIESIGGDGWQIMSANKI